MKTPPKELWVEQLEDGTMGKAPEPGGWNTTNLHRTKYVRFDGPTYTANEFGEFLNRIVGGRMAHLIIDEFRKEFKP